MFVSSPLFPITLTKEKARAELERELRKKNWRDFSLGELKLVLVPFYFFNYSIALAGKKGGREVVKETRSGRAALDAQKAELREDMAARLPDEGQLSGELPDGMQVETKKPSFPQEEAKKIAAMKVAEREGAGKEEVVLSRFQMVYFPKWLAEAELAGKKHVLEISAAGSGIFGEESIPEKKQSMGEVAGETLQELKEPKAWLQYSREIAGKAAEKLSGKVKVKGGREAEEATTASARVDWKGLVQKPSFWLSIALLLTLILIILYF